MNAERPFRFGRGHHLVGVAGVPQSMHSDIGVIVLNAGLVHRVGPFRLHVELTRALNRLGYATLRMDLSTLGDSGATDESHTYPERTRADIRDAMDQLRAHAGCTRFVLAGLCSGAENAYLGASTEDGIVGAVFIDGYAYRTSGFLLRHYLPRLLNPARVMRFLLRKMQRKGGGASNSRFSLEFPPREEVREKLRGMLDRDIRLFFIFSGGARSYFNHRRQFKECFGSLARDPGVCIRFLKESDHTFILSGDRKELIEMIGNWITHNLPARTGGTTP